MAIGWQGGPLVQVQKGQRNKNGGTKIGRTKIGRIKICSGPSAIGWQVHLVQVQKDQQNKKWRN